MGLFPHLRWDFVYFYKMLSSFDQVKELVECTIHAIGHILIFLYRSCCHGNNLRSNIAVTVYNLSLRLVVSDLLLLEVLYQIQMCLKVVQIHRSM